MFTDIHLLNVPELDVYHNHTFAFANKEQQLNYFLSRKINTIENVNYHRKNNNLKVNYHIDDLQFVNYVMINNEKPLNKWYYYFVIDRKYINESCTELTLKLDVMQTYLFDYTFKSSLVERMHYNRFNNDGTVNKAYFKEEDHINTGEYIKEDIVGRYKYNKKGSFIIASTTMLGFDDKRKQGSDIIDDNKNKVDEVFGDISANIFRFLKGYEGYSASAYQDSVGVWTIGYGTTQNSHLDAYNDMLLSNSEEKASNYMYQSIKNSYYKGIIDEILNKRNKPCQNEIDAFVSLAYNCGVGGCTSSPMYQSYISNKSILDCSVGWIDYKTNNGDNGLIARRKAEVNIFVNASYEYRAITNLSGGIILANNGHGYIPSNLKWIVLKENNSGDRVVASARKLIGKPYRYGGNYPPLDSLYGNSSDGTDCSGLCQWAYNDANVNTGLTGRWTTNTMYPYTAEISLNSAQSGDVLYSGFVNGVPSHVRIIEKVTGDIVYWVGAENESIGIVEGKSTFNSNYKIGRFS